MHIEPDSNGKYIIELNELVGIEVIQSLNTISLSGYTDSTEAITIPVTFRVSRSDAQKLRITIGSAYISEMSRFSTADIGSFTDAKYPLIPTGENSLSVSKPDIPTNDTVEITMNMMVSVGGPTFGLLYADSTHFKVVLGNKSAFDGIEPPEGHPAMLIGPFTFGGDTSNAVNVSGGFSSEVTFAADWTAEVNKHYTAIPVVNGLMLQTGNLFKRGASPQDYYEAYADFLGEMFWLGKKHDAFSTMSYPWTSHYFGISQEMNAFMVTPVDSIPNKTPTYGKYTNVFDVNYIFGDLCYPAKIDVTGGVPVFDVVIDSDIWTEEGPLSEEYYENASTPGFVETIYSWTGRQGMALIVGTKNTFLLKD